MAWNKPAANPQPKQKKPSAKPTLKHGIIAGAAVVVIGLAALWIFSGGETAPKAKVEKTPARIKEVKPATPVTKITQDDQPPIDKMNDIEFLKKWTKEHNKKVEIPLPNGDKRVIKDGKSHYVLRPIVDKTKPDYKPPIFKHPLENYLATFIDPGQPVSRVPFRISDEKAREIIKEPVPIELGKDDEDTLYKKQEVIAFKQQLAQWMDEGKSAQSFLDALKARQQRESDRIQETERFVMQSIRDGDVEIAKGVLDRMNKKLAEDGLPTVRLHGKYKHAVEALEAGKSQNKEE